MTAQQLHEIGERVELEIRSRKPSGRADIDRRRLYAVVVRLIGKSVANLSDPGEPDEWCACIPGISATAYATKDAAIDALLGDA